MCDCFLLGLTVPIVERNHPKLILSEPRQAWTTYPVEEASLNLSHVSVRS